MKCRCRWAEHRHSRGRRMLSRHTTLYALSDVHFFLLSFIFHFFGRYTLTRQKQGGRVGACEYLVESTQWLRYWSQCVCVVDCSLNNRYHKNSINGKWCTWCPMQSSRSTLRFSMPSRTLRGSDGIYFACNFLLMAENESRPKARHSPNILWFPREREREARWDAKWEWRKSEILLFTSKRKWTKWPVQWGKKSLALLAISSLFSHSVDARHWLKTMANEVDGPNGPNRMS